MKTLESGRGTSRGGRGGDARAEKKGAPSFYRVLQGGGGNAGFTPISRGEEPREGGALRKLKSAGETRGAS